MDEERVVHEEYKIWKKNCPLLYDVVVTNALVWPSLTCQWLPEKKVLPGSKFAEHKMILGTHTSEGEPNYLMIARINVPLPTAQVTSAKYDDASGEAGNFGASTSKLEITQRIAHEGEINRARYMPQNPFIIATKTPSANVHVFDVSQHPSRPTTDTPRPNMTLRGHEREGYGLAWNPNVPGQLLSGSDDRLICLWNVSQEGGNDGSDPIATFKGHGDVVGDVCWHASNPNMFASVGDDGKLLIWDSRQADATLRCSAHSGQINSVGFNPFSEHLIATAASDKTVALFDIRKIGVKVYSLLGHSSEVVQLSWSPHNEAVLASSATDRRVHIWDLSRIGQELSLEDSGDGAPELLFVHGGHTAKVSDFSWNPNDPWVMASVAEDNIVQVWQMCENIYLQEDDLPDAAAHELEGNAE